MNNALWTLWNVPSTKVGMEHNRVKLSASQQRVVDYISDNPGKTTSREISTNCEIYYDTARCIIRRLYNRGIIYRHARKVAHGNIEYVYHIANKVAL